MMPMDAEIGRKHKDRKNPLGTNDPHQWTQPSQAQATFMISLSLFSLLCKVQIQCVIIFPVTV